MRYRIRNTYLLREIAGEPVILSLDPNGPVPNGMMNPNGTATFLWKCFQQFRTVEEVTGMVLDSYDVHPEQAASAVNRFVDELVNYKIIEEEK